MASFTEPPQTTDPLELLRHFQREAERRETPKTELPKGILERPSEEVDDKSYGVMKFFADWWSGTENKVAEARKEVLEGLVNMPMPTLPTPASEALDATLTGRESEPVIEGVAPDKPSMLKPEVLELEVDTRSNEALDKSNQTMSKAIEDVLETVVNSDVSDSTDSADGGAAPSDGKGIMSREALTDDDMGLPTKRSETERQIAFEPLFGFIEKGEGGYEASNRGTIKNSIIGSTNATERNGKALTEMTIGEIREKQAITDANNPERLFAVGRFQVIPSTLEMVISSLGLSDDTVFNENTQNKIGMYLVTEKRPNVGRYLKDVGNISQNTAMLELAKEFASMPVPYDMTVKRNGKDVKIKKGDSYYGNGNKAQHSYTEVKKQLEELKGTI